MRNGTREGYDPTPLEEYLERVMGRSNGTGSIDGTRRTLLRAVGGIAVGASGVLAGCGGGGDAGAEELAVAQSTEPTQGAERVPRSQLYSVTDIGSLGGTVSGIPEGLNDHGDVVGWSETPTSQVTHAFLYRRGTMTDLGTLGDGYSLAHDINDKGQVVGEFAGGALPHGFLYIGGVMRDLGTLGGLSSVANGINNHGHVVGNSQLNDGVSLVAAHFFFSGLGMTSGAVSRVTTSFGSGAKVLVASS